MVFAEPMWIEPHNNIAYMELQTQVILLYIGDETRMGITRI
jgi:hypothetical protein